MAFHDGSPEFSGCVTIREHGCYVTVGRFEETLAPANLFDSSTASVLRVIISEPIVSCARR
jgi:hypothetical protein